MVIEKWAAGTGGQPRRVAPGLTDDVYHCRSRFVLTTGWKRDPDRNTFDPRLACNL